MFASRCRFVTQKLGELSLKTADWKQNALGVINNVLSEPLKLRVNNVIGGGDQPWAVLELEANSTCKNGMEYPQRYAWVLRFNDEGIVVQAKAYLDSALVQKVVDANTK
jgi:ketosteroid isomerase-like protein